MTYNIYFCRFATATGNSNTQFLNFHLYCEEVKEAQTDYYVWVIKNDERTVLVDTGFSGLTSHRRGKTMFVEVPHFWDQIGVDRTKPIDVILTHLHYDHAGNLDYLNNPHVLISRSERDFWFSDSSDGFLISYYKEDQDLASIKTLEDQGNVTLFDGEYDLAPGIKVIEIGGHTPGQCIVLVDTCAGRICLASDAVHFHRELNEDKPFTAVTDLPALYNGLKRIRTMLEQGEIVKVISGHDPIELDLIQRLTEHTGMI